MSSAARSRTWSATAGVYLCDVVAVVQLVVVSVDRAFEVRERHARLRVALRTDYWERWFLVVWSCHSWSSGDSRPRRKTGADSRRSSFVGRDTTRVYQRHFSLLGPSVIVWTRVGDSSSSSSASSSRSPRCSSFRSSSTSCWPSSSPTCYRAGPDPGRTVGESAHRRGAVVALASVAVILPLVVVTRAVAADAAALFEGIRQDGESVAELETSIEDLFGTDVSFSEMLQSVVSNGGSDAFGSILGVFGAVTHAVIGLRAHHLPAVLLPEGRRRLRRLAPVGPAAPGRRPRRPVRRHRRHHLGRPRRSRLHRHRAGRHRGARPLRRRRSERPVLDVGDDRPGAPPGRRIFPRLGAGGGVPRPVGRPIPPRCCSSTGPSSSVSRTTTSVLSSSTGTPTSTRASSSSASSAASTPSGSWACSWVRSSSARSGPPSTSTANSTRPTSTADSRRTKSGYLHAPRQRFR